MRALQVIRRDFSHKTRERGKDYYRRGAVEIVDSEPNHIRARVQGTDLYNLSIDWDGSQYSYSCSCPRFQEHEDLCKHIWATLLAADARGILPGAGDFANEIESDEEDERRRGVHPRSPDDEVRRSAGRTHQIPRASACHRAAAARHLATAAR